MSDHTTSGMKGGEEWGDRGVGWGYDRSSSRAAKLGMGGSPYCSIGRGGMGCWLQGGQGVGSPVEVSQSTLLSSSFLCLTPPNQHLLNRPVHLASTPQTSAPSAACLSLTFSPPHQPPPRPSSPPHPPPPGLQVPAHCLSSSPSRLLNAPSSRCQPTSISLKAGCELFLRYTTRTSELEMEDFAAAKARLIEVRARGGMLGNVGIGGV
jgi:hypothetical protein